MALKAGMTIEAREKTRAALLHVANDDLARVLLANPRDVARHIARAILSIDQPTEIAASKLLAGAPQGLMGAYFDPNAASFDLDAALGAEALATGDKLWVSQHRMKLQEDEAKQPKPTGTALEWKEKGNAANAKKDSDAALAAYNTALRIDPKFADALNNRSGSYRQRAQWDLALCDLDEAIRIEPKHRAANMNRAAVKLEVGDFDGSVADARHAVEVAPDDATRQAANETLVRCLFARADHHSDTKSTLAVAFDDYHEGNTLAATTKLPPDATMLQYEGTMAAQVSKGTAAITALRAAHAAKPDDIWIEGWLTVVATALNDPEAPTFEKDISTRGDRNTLSNIDDVANSFSKDGPRLTAQTDAEATRMKALRDRLFDAYRNKPGGRVISAGEQ